MWLVDNSQSFGCLKTYLDCPQEDVIICTTRKKMEMRYRTKRLRKKKVATSSRAKNKK